MKLCRTCNENKDDSCFGKRSASHDGLSSKCKSCQREYDRSRPKKKKVFDPCPHGEKRTRPSADGLTASCKECLKQRDKNRNDDPSRVAAREAYAKTEVGIAAGNRAKKKWLDNNSIKRGVHVITGNAIRDGKLIKQPCEVCGCKEVHAHHDDYAKPLEVRWLCNSCHNDWHKENGEAKNAS